MTRWFERLKQKLRRPNVGATGELKSLRVIEIGHPWIDRLSKWSAWIVIGFVAAVSLLSDGTDWNIPIAITLGVYVAYILLLETGSRKLTEFYDLLPVRIFRILANLTVVSALIYNSGGAESYFWCLYAVPLFQANMYLRRWGVGAIYILTWILYGTVSSQFFAAATTSRASGLFITNSLTLFSMAILLYWLFGAARSRRRVEYQVRETLRATVLASSGQLDQKTLDTIIRGAVAVLNASGGGIYEYDEEREELTVAADYGGVRSIKGHKLKKGEGLAGRVVEEKVSKIVDDYSTWEFRCPELEPNLFRAVVEVPLLLPERVIGVLYVTDDKWNRRFTPGEAEILELLASHAAIAVNNASLFEESRKNIRRLELLDSVSSKMTYARNFKDNLMTILEEALKAVSADSGSIMIVDPKTKDLDILALIIDKEAKDSGSHKRKDGIAAFVAETGEPINCTDTEKDGRYVKSEDRMIRSIISVPIIKNKKLFCLINADDPRPNHFKDEDIQLFSSLGEHVATMIESLRLREIVLSLSSLPLDQLQSKIAESAFTLIRGDIATLNMVDQKGCIDRVATYPVNERKELEAPRTDGLTSKILKGGQYKIINDVQNNAEVRPELRASAIKSLIGIPLLTDGAADAEKAIGVLFVFSKTPREFGLSEKQILETLAHQAASAIIQRRLHDEVTSELKFQERLLSSAFDAIIAVNKKGLVTEFNTGAEKILGYSKAEVLNTDVTQYYRDPSDAHEVLQLLLKEENKGRLINHYTYVRAKNDDVSAKNDDKIIPIRLSASLLDDGSVGFFRDQREIENMRQHLQHLRGLLMTGKAITEQNELPKLLQSIARGALETLHADVVWIYHYNRESDDLHLSPTMAPEDNHGDQAEFDVKPFLHTVMASDTVHFVEDVDSDESDPAFARACGLRSLATGPLRVREKRMGVMICGYRNPKRFDDEEQIAMRVLISDAAIALDHSEERQQVTALLDRLYKTNLNLTMKAPPKSRLRQILQHAKSVTNAQSGALGILGPDKTLQDFILVDVDSTEEPKIASPHHYGLLSQLLKPDAVINDGNIVGRAIMLNGRPVGSIYLENKKGGDKFSDADALILGIFANLVSVIMERQLERHAWRMREAISLGSMLLAQLRHAARERWQVILSELKDVSTGANEHQLETLNRVKAQIQELERALEDVQTGIENGPAERVPLDSLLYRIARRNDIPAELLEINAPRVCFVRGNALLLTLAFRILVENALGAVQKASNDRPKRVLLKCDLQDGVLKGFIQDSGDGIPEAMQPDLYVRPLKRQNGRQTYGSYIAGAIMNWHGGDVRIAKTGPEGTVIEFSIAEGGD